MSAEDRLKQLGLVLPQVPSPVANYVSYRIAGNILYLAGQGPRGADGVQLTGKVGAEISVDEGYRRARLVGLQLLATTRTALGSLDRVDFVVKMLCMVNAVADFKDHPKVANGMSDLLSKCWVMPASTRGQRWGWAPCPIKSRLRSRAYWQSSPDRARHCADRWPVQENRQFEHLTACGCA
jgi:enamine deaminase RidA (YjgF/YER057c/UK114 family)